MITNFFFHRKAWMVILLLISTLSFGQAYKAQLISFNTGSATWCPGETRAVSITLKNIGTSPWTDGGGNIFNVGVKWNTNGTSWTDYHVRTSAQNLAPGLMGTFNFIITASNNVNGTYGGVLATGTNNLIFDVVLEGKSWFGDNGGGTGPGNVKFTTPVQTIGVSIANNKLSYTNGTSGSASGTAPENGTATLTAPAGTYFSTVNFASYGTPMGTAPNFTLGTCHAANSQTVVEGLLLGMGTTAIGANNIVFGDPCVNTVKNLAVSASYVQPLCNGNSVTITGTTPTGVPEVFTYRWESSTTSATTGFATAAGVSNLINYTSVAITQNTWFRRVVLACNTSNTSSVILVKVNPAINTGAIAATGQTVCYNGDPGIIGSTTNASGGDGTVKYKWQANAVDITGATGATYDPPSGLVTTTTYRRFATDTSCNSFLVSTGSWIVTVRPQFTTGAIASTGQSVCSGGDPGIIGNTTGASGGDGTITYKWQANNVDIAGATASSYDPPAGLLVNTVYQRFAKDATCNTTFALSTGSWTVSITPENTVGAASSSPNLCVNTAMTVITHATTGATGIGTPSGLPAGTNASFSSNTISISGNPAAIGTFNYSIPLNGGCGNKFATGTITVVGAGSTTNDRFINDVKFLGTLNPDTDNTSTYSSGGYGDFTYLTDKAKQIQGGVINLNVNVGVTAGTNLSTIKAWVDWNKDGVFTDDVSEKIYDTSEVGVNAGNVIFGYVVPAAVPRGIYTIRIRINSGNETFGPCGTTINGETEDYSFYVIDNCAAKIQSVAVSAQCGPGPVTLTATGNSSTASYNWYNDEFGNAIPGQTGNTYTTGSLAVGSYTFYVIANSAACSSPNRTPVKVVVSPAPAILLTKNAPDICGATTSLIITSSGDKQQVTVLEDKFEDTPANPVKFENVTAGNTNVNGAWQLRNTPYIPTSPEYNILKPAISSGYDGGKFANIITDVRQNTNILNYWVTKNPLITTGVTNLKMDFDLYYFSEEDVEARNNLKVQYSMDGLTNWIDLKTYFSDQGSPGRFISESLTLPAACENSSTLKIRFSAFATGSAAEWLADIAAIDNVRIYGVKDLPTNLIWSGDTNVIFPSTCTGTIPSGGASSVCIKVSDADLKAKSQFTVTATAALSNGCTTTGTIIINNNTKIWDATATTNWNTNNWQPVDSKIPPVSDKCVIIRTPLILGAGAAGFAKNVKVEGAGKLTLNAAQSLTVTDEFVNTLSTADVVLESESNLVQINNTAANAGTLTSKRDIKIGAARNQYNYLGTPVAFSAGETFKTIYPGITQTLYHNEPNNKFYTSSGVNIPGRGLAVKEPTVAGFPSGAFTTATYKGSPQNGVINLGILNSNTAVSTVGYNLAGNPYPSNIDLRSLYNANGGKTSAPQTVSPNISSTFYFWDNNNNLKFEQQGTGYNGEAYAIFNVLASPVGTGLGTKSGINSKVPTGIVKVGQGFMTRSLLPAYTLKFDNSTRTTTGSATDFLGKPTEIGVDRFWLELAAPTGIVSPLAIVYFEGGNNAVGAEDSKSLGGSDAFYSVVDGEQLAINGRPPFTDADKISLGSNYFVEGNYTIALSDKEGIFTGGQKIYLKDKQMGILTDLLSGSYTFNTVAGESTGRFEIVFKPETVLATGTDDTKMVEIYRDGIDFVVRSGRENLTAVQVFDAGGRLMLNFSGNQKEWRFPASYLISGIYVVKGQLKSGKTLTRKIRK